MFRLESKASILKAFGEMVSIFLFYIVFTYTGSVRNVRNDVNIYIYIYIYVNNMVDAKSVHNLSAIFR